MEKLQISALPLEIRTEIWTFALLPDPSVYHFDPSDFDVRKEDDFESQPWLIPKRAYPTAMHLCAESRTHALRLMERDPTLRIGLETRPFDPAIDTFWFHKTGPDHPWVTNTSSVIGSRVHTIQRLAIRAGYIRSVEPGKQRVSCWDSFRSHRLHRFVSLRRVDVVMGKAHVRQLSVQTDDGSDAGKAEDEEYEEDEDGAPQCHAFDVPELRVKKWAKKGASAEEAREKVEKARKDVRQVFQRAYERLSQEGSKYEPPMPPEAPGWQDGSQIVFRAVRMARVATYRGRSVRYFKVNI
ncbi:hypothetical protein N0V93_003952 [Gnomoniopsis smithogilvyi]|uniref:2EXR domain-containing protein n=1 Tax=Gnomoniopsis smithogilvyi TaxID=1191159 RepID=A0A9W8YZM8_9PEZI|nr:hypothetical protein N0V93_003952 [Gnomoniopsis smithogilvyi]